MSTEHVKSFIRLFPWPLPAMIKETPLCWTPVGFYVLVWNSYNAQSILFLIPFLRILLGVYVIWGIILLILEYVVKAKVSLLSRYLYRGSCCGLVAIAFTIVILDHFILVSDTLLFLFGLVAIMSITIVLGMLMIKISNKKHDTLSVDDKWKKQKKELPQWLIALGATGGAIGFLISRIIVSTLPDETVQSPAFIIGGLLFLYIAAVFCGVAFYYISYWVHKLKITYADMEVTDS